MIGGLLFRRESLRPLSWGAVFVVVATVSLCVPALCLRRGSSGVAALRKDVEQRSSELGARIGDTPDEVLVTALELELEECERLAREESEQLAQLSAAAHSSGVRVISIESLGVEPVPETRVQAHPKALELQCTYRQLAEFLGSVPDLRGEAAVLDFTVRPAIEQSARDSEQPLHATMTVAWYGTRGEPPPEANP